MTGLEAQEVCSNDHIRCLSAVPLDLQNLVREIEAEEALAQAAVEQGEQD